MAENACDLRAEFATPRLMQSWLQRMSFTLTVLLCGQASATPGRSKLAPTPVRARSGPAVSDPRQATAPSQFRVHARVPLAPAGLLVRRQKPPEAALRTGSSSSGSGRGSAARQPARKPPPAPTVELEHLTTHATYRLRPDSLQGGFSAAKLRALSQLLRCHHTGKRHAISERLIQILYATARHYHNAKLYIVAGYRAPKIARQKGNPKSPHKRGVACDFQVAGVANEEVRDYLRSTYPRIGLGYYPRSGFVHVDVGRKVGAYWIDYSGPGERARYGRKDAVESASSERGRAEEDTPAVELAQQQAPAPGPESAPTGAGSGDTAADATALLPAGPAAAAEDPL